MGQCVLPAQIIPVIHRQGQHDQRGVFRQFCHQFVRWRTGRATLAGEQFDYRTGLLLRSRLGLRGQRKQ
jgi:hypothetical protein